MLQNLAFLGEDGQVYGVRPVVQPQMVGAWLDEDGEIRTINDLQNLNIGELEFEDQDFDLEDLRLGAWLDEDGEIRTVNDLQNLMISRSEMIDIAVGVLEGALATDGLDNYAQCFQDSKTVVTDMEQAITNFRRYSVRGTASGLSYVAEAVKQMLSMIDLCAKPEDLEKIEELKTMIKSFTIRTFAYHVGNAIYYNGKNIYDNLSDAWKMYNDNNLKAFGQDIGKSLALVIMGDKAQSATEEPAAKLNDAEIPIVEVQDGQTPQLALLLI